jgi:hypothetical protein
MVIIRIHWTGVGLKCQLGSILNFNFFSNTTNEDSMFWSRIFNLAYNGTRVTPSTHSLRIPDKHKKDKNLTSTPKTTTHNNAIARILEII